MFSIAKTIRAGAPTVFAVIFMSCLLCLATALPAPAGQAIDETHKVNRNAVVTIDNLAGSVTVTGSSRNEVKITGTLDDKAEELRVTGDANQLAIEVRYPEKTGSIKNGSHLEIQVPIDSRLEIETVSANVSVDRCEGPLTINTISGEAVLRGKPAAVRAETVSGGLDLDATTDRAVLSSISGGITAKGVRHHLSCNTISGNIKVAVEKDLTALNCEVISGDITVTGQPARKAEWDLSAHSGNVTVNLIGKVDARFRLKTFSGTIDDAFGHAAERTSQYVPGKELSFTEGDGEALVKVSVFSGNIRIQRQ